MRKNFKASWVDKNKHNVNKFRKATEQGLLCPVGSEVIKPSFVKSHALRTNLPSAF